MKKLILIKFGGSLITDKAKPFTERKDIIKRLSTEVHSARSKSESSVILGHGGGSYPHVPAKKYRTVDGVIDINSYLGIAEVQDAASRLNRIVVRSLINVGEAAISMSPSSLMTSKNKKPSKIFLESLDIILDFNMLPVFYGDVVVDENIGCTIFSTEKVLTFIASKLHEKYKIEKIIYCGITDGVYDSRGKTIDKITPKNFSAIKGQIVGSGGIDVTGGMIHKVKESLAVSKKYGIKTIIINGLISGRLEKTILGKENVGTVITSQI